MVLDSNMFNDNDFREHYIAAKKRYIENKYRSVKNKNWEGDKNDDFSQHKNYEGEHKDDDWSGQQGGDCGSNWQQGGDLQVSIDDAYSDAISTLRTFCSDSKTKLTDAQIRETLKRFDKYDNILKKFNILNVSELLASNMTVQDVYSRYCNVINDKVLDILTKEKALARKIINEVDDPKKQMTSATVAKYVKFATDNNLLDKSVYEIFKTYSDKAYEYSKIWKEKERENDDILKTLSNKYKTKSGKHCISGCERVEERGRTPYYACQIKKSAGLFGNKKGWDYCQPSLDQQQQQTLQQPKENYWSYY